MIEGADCAGPDLHVVVPLNLDRALLLGEPSGDDEGDSQGMFVRYSGRRDREE